MVATLAMLFCGGVAVFAPPLWTGVSGRDFRPQATTMTMLLLFVSLSLRAAPRWPIVDLVGSLFCAEVITLGVIAYFSVFTGLEMFNAFNLQWLATMSVFIAAPWLVGLLAGSLILRYRDRHTRNANQVIADPNN